VEEVTGTEREAAALICALEIRVPLRCRVDEHALDPRHQPLAGTRLEGAQHQRLVCLGLFRSALSRFWIRLRVGSLRTHIGDRTHEKQRSRERRDPARWS
jgi:hypothetical protein